MDVEEDQTRTRTDEQAETGRVEKEQNTMRTCERKGNTKSGDMGRNVNRWMAIENLLNHQEMRSWDKMEVEEVMEDRS